MTGLTMRELNDFFTLQQLHGIASMCDLIGKGKIKEIGSSSINDPEGHIDHVLEKMGIKLTNTQEGLKKIHPEYSGSIYVGFFPNHPSAVGNRIPPELWLNHLKDSVDKIDKKSLEFLDRIFAILSSMNRVVM